METKAPTTGAGILDPKTGHILPKHEQNESEPQRRSIGSEPASRADFASQARNVFGAIRSEISQRANFRIEDANDRIDRVARAQKFTQEVAVTLQDFKQAFSDGDTESVTNVREKLAALQSQARELEQALQAEEREQTQERDGTEFVAVGNKVGEFPDRVLVIYRAPKTDLASINSKAALKSALSELGESRVALRETKEAIGEEKVGIRQVVQGARAEVKATQAEVLQSEAAASQLAEKIARDLTSQAAAGANIFVSNLTQDSVQRLLTA